MKTERNILSLVIDTNDLLWILEKHGYLDQLAKEPEHANERKPIVKLPLPSDMTVQSIIARSLMQDQIQINLEHESFPQWNGSYFLYNIDIDKKERIMDKSFDWNGQVYWIRATPALDSIDPCTGQPEIKPDTLTGSYQNCKSLIENPLIDSDFKTALTAALVDWSKSYKDDSHENK